VSKIKAEMAPRFCVFKMPGCKNLIPMEYVGGKKKAEKDYKKLTSCTNPACSTAARQEGRRYHNKPKIIQYELDDMHLYLMGKIGGPIRSEE